MARTTAPNRFRAPLPLASVALLMSIFGCGGGDGGQGGTTPDGGCADDEKVTWHVGGACGPRTLDDPANCGAPGNACELTTLATGQSNPLEVAVDGNNIYWTNWGSYTVTGCGPTGGSFQGCFIQYTENLDGSVMTMPLAGGAPVALVTNRVEPTTIGVDGTNVYWAERGGALMKLPLRGGPPSELAPEHATFALFGDAIYYTDGVGSVFVAQAAGGTPTTLAAGQSDPGPIAVDATSVFWINRGGSYPVVMKAPRSGGDAVTVKTLLYDAFAFAVDSTNLYYGDGTLLLETPRSCGPTNILANGSSMVARGTTLFFETLADLGNLIVVSSADTECAKEVRLWAEPAVHVHGLAADDTSVYWAKTVDADFLPSNFYPPTNPPPPGTVFGNTGMIMRQRLCRAGACQ